VTTYIEPELALFFRETAYRSRNRPKRREAHRVASRDIKVNHNASEMIRMIFLLTLPSKLDPTSPLHRYPYRPGLFLPPCITNLNLDMRFFALFTLLVTLIAVSSSPAAIAPKSEGTATIPPPPHKLDNRAVRQGSLCASVPIKARLTILTYVSRHPTSPHCRFPS